MSIIKKLNKKVKMIKFRKTGNLIHLEIHLLIFRFTFYKLRNKFTIRLEASRGWN